jgi:hypothetical protein
MFFSSWPRKRTPPGASEARRTSKPTRRQGTFRPRLEALEDRWLPSTLTVTSPKDDGPHSLRAEIAAASANDVIVFSPKLDGQTLTLTSVTLYITKNLTIQGPGAGQLTISGGNDIRVFEIAPNTTVTLSGLTITKGNSSSGTGPTGNLGGGILNQGTLTVSGCTVSGNSGNLLAGNAKGGGIYNTGTLTVSGCTISGNYANYGGGIYNAGTATVSSSNLYSNSAFTPEPIVGPDPYVGGGIYNAGAAAALTVLDSIFSSNSPNNIFGLYTDGGGNTFK